MRKMITYKVDSSNLQEYPDENWAGYRGCDACKWNGR